MHELDLPVTPGAVIGYRRNGTPIRLIAGGSGDNGAGAGDGQGGTGAADGGPGTTPGLDPAPKCCIKAA